MRSGTFLSLLFLSGQGQRSFFFLAPLRFPLKTDHLIESVALTASFWRLLNANTNKQTIKSGIDHEEKQPSVRI